MPPADREALHDRALGAYLGLAVGDALGATVEFMTPREIQLRYGVHRDIVGGGWLNLPAGRVTDDTTMSLTLGDALLAGFEQGRPYDTHLMAEAFVAWLRGRPVDCGNTCRRGIQRYLMHGTLQGACNEGDGGNGALMRNLPVVLATLHEPAALPVVSLTQARLTHHHPLSDAAVLGLAALTRALLLGQTGVEGLIQTMVADTPAFRFHPYPGRASGYVVDTMQTVLHHFSAYEDFESALVATVNQGDDADTTGALVGMLTGARCGARALPQRWVSRLDRKTVTHIEQQVAGLLHWSCGMRP